jgi:hypothetical protein
LVPRPGRATGEPSTHGSGGDDREERNGTTQRSALGRSATTLAEVSRELADWVPILRRLAETEVLRDLALGHCSELSGSAVRSIIAARRLRDDYFWPAMTEAAWALMLQLFAARLDGQRIDLAGLGKATDLPSSSIRHWVDWLAGRGMIFLNGDSADEGAAAIDLSEAGADEMRAYLLASLRLSPWIQ